MPFTRDPGGRALLGGLSLERLLEHPGVETPCYVYDVDGVVAEARALSGGFGGRPHLVCYAAKANSAGRILRRLAEAGVGADIVSGGELAVCLGAGISPERIVWSGVAKTSRELDQALGAGERGILSLHLESAEEIERVEARARALGRRGRVSLRVNPGVEADTHAHIATGHDEAKFGVVAADVPGAIARIRESRSLELVGLSTHIGSQLVSTGAYAAAARVVCELARGLPLALLDMGGGFGVDYGEGCPARPADFARAAVQAVDESGARPGLLLCEPGRSLVAAEGALLARVLQTKRWSRPGSAGWVFLDAGMNDLLRPALYAARHRIEPLRASPGVETAAFRVAGPVCESSDDFGLYTLPDPPPAAVVIRDAGAYGHAMASHYNGRRLACEVFVEGGRVSAVSTAGSVDEWVRARLAT